MVGLGVFLFQQFDTFLHLLVGQTLGIGYFLFSLHLDFSQPKFFGFQLLQPIEAVLGALFPTLHFFHIFPCAKITFVTFDFQLKVIYLFAVGITEERTTYTATVLCLVGSLFHLLFQVSKSCFGFL